MTAFLPRRGIAMKSGLSVAALLLAGGSALQVVNPAMTAAPVSAALENDAHAALFAVAHVGPGEPVRRCIGVTNTGSTPADVGVSLERPPAGTGLANFSTVTIERGRRPAAVRGGSCGAFRPEAREAVFFTGRLDEVPVGLEAPVRDGGGPLAPREERAYRISWSVVDDPRAQGLTVGGVSFVWSPTAAA